MENSSFKVFDGKVVIRLKDRVCDTPDELFSSEIFRMILARAFRELSRKGSRLLQVFGHTTVSEQDIDLLLDSFRFLVKLPSNHVQQLLPESAIFFKDPLLFNELVEYLYNYWRSLQRLVVCDSEGDRLDERPYRTFNRTVESLTHLIRGAYRDIQENITGNHPRIYRQVRAGAEVGAIALPKDIPYPDNYQYLNSIAVIRQILIYPPLIFNPSMNKRTGIFTQVSYNPLENVDLDRDDWLCYPAKVGPLLVMVYFSMRFFELGFSLCNLFELAGNEDLQRKPDAVYLFGVPEGQVQFPPESSQIFYEDNRNDMLVAAIPGKNEFGYFGYLKKMILTLHNIRMMKAQRMPFHGAMVNLDIQGRGNFTLLILGDTGAGKSETLEAFRTIAAEDVKDMVIIADDMGSLDIDADGNIIGYGTETGAFVRLDDLQPGYAFGQIDRTIIMSPNQTNARVVLPVTTYDNITKGFAVDLVLYANNYEHVDADHPIIERFTNPGDAIDVFRAGRVMSKGTTSTTGLVQTYFANVFGPQQYQDIHEEIAKKFFQAFFGKGIFVGQLRTRLGLAGWEQDGPVEAAKALLQALRR